MATETINGQKYYTGSFGVQWDLDWGGYLALHTDFNIYAQIPDTLDHVECWIDISSFDTQPGDTGGGFYNVGGIMWETGAYGPDYIRYIGNAVNDDISYASDIYNIPGVPDRVIRGFICNDKTQVITDFASHFETSYLLGSKDNPVIIDLSNSGEIQTSQLIVRGFSRWLNWDESPDYDPTHKDWDGVGTIATGEIYLEDLFPDYYPWAILKDNTWASANRAGGNHKMIQNSTWRDDKNNFLLQKNQTVYQLKSDGWLRCDEIGAE